MKFSYLVMNSYQGVAPGLESWPADPDFCKPDVAQTSTELAFELASYAEQLGFDWVSCSEHHYAPYMMTPNPIVMAAALSQVVRRAGIALLGPLVPLNNPVRLAEEVALLDQLTGGRVKVLFLRGTPNEHNTYSAIDGDTRALTQEGIELILKTWAETKPFGWESEHYRFATVAAWPRPRQQPRPMTYGSGNSEESIAFAARHRLGIAFSFAPPEVVKKWVDLYREQTAREGWEPGADHVLYRGMALVGDTDAEAEGILAEHFGKQAEEKARLQAKTMGGPPIAPLIAKPYFLGSVETVIERANVLRDIGVGVLDLNVPFGSIEQQKRTLALLAEKVMPALRD